MAEVLPKKMPRKIRKNYDEPVRDEELLSDELKATIREKAKTEVLEAKRKEAAKLLLEKYKEEELAALEPAKVYGPVQIDVPGYTKYIMIDGRQMPQGDTVSLTEDEKRSVADIMNCAWKHETSNGGAHMKDYRPPIDAANLGQNIQGYRKLLRI